MNLNNWLWREWLPMQQEFSTTRIEKSYSTQEVALKLAGNRIAEARKAAGLTQKALAERVGVTQSEISRIENNPDATTVKTLKRVARALKVDVPCLIDPAKSR